MYINNVYKCSKCKNSYILDEYFDTKEKTNYKEHSPKLQEINNKNNNIKVNIPNNVKDEPKINVIDDYLGNINKIKKRDEYKKDNNIIKNINKIVDEEEEKEYEEKEEEFNVDIEINQILMKYFFNKKGNLIIEVANPSELDKVKNNYLTLIKKNIDIKYIQKLQNDYISLCIHKNKKSLRNNQINILNNRIDKLRQIINKDFKYLL